MPSVADAPPSKPSPPEVVAQALRSCWERVEKEFRRFRRHADAAKTHDLRVALRRLLVAAELASALDENLLPPKLERELKGLLGALSPLRDVEIQRQALKERTLAPEAERALKRHLGRRERRERKLLARLLEDFALRKRAHAVARACATLEVEREQRSPSARLAVVGAIARRYVVFDRRRRSSHADLEHLHRVRIAFKQYRYAVELGASFLRPVPEKARDAMKAFQDRLGDLQDSVVLIDLFSRE
ncbi:MAG TPA: CHAD domain-containing protein, partial [Polyangiaceae bacterium]|nr:CHAD domain-containing protein [Polyangiaceae bacterium]